MRAEALAANVIQVTKADETPPLWAACVNMRTSWFWHRSVCARCPASYTSVAA